MPTRRHFVNAAPSQTLASSITNSATSLTVAGSFSGWPVLFPFYATLDIGTASAEVVSVTAIVGTTATIVRGQDGTAAISHAAGATFDHTFVAGDADEANAHTSASAGVHGLAGSVVGTTDIQTLTNKTLTAPTMTSPTVSGTVTNSATNNLTGAGTALAVTNNATFGTASVTGALTAASETAILIPKSFTNEAAAGTQPAGAIVELTAPTNTYGAGFYVSAGAGAWLPAGLDGAWKSYTPALTASTTNPTLGTGSVQTGKWTQIGKTVIGEVQIAFGTSGAVAGSGTYTVSLPVAATAFGANTNLPPLGVFLLKSAGLWTRGDLIYAGAGTTTTTAQLGYLSAAVNGTIGFASNAAPGAWTNNDEIRYTFWYQAA